MGQNTDGNLPADALGYRALGGYSPGMGTVAAQSGTVLTDAAGTNYAPLVVQMNASQSVNGTLQSAAGANGNGTALALLGMASVILTVTQAAFTGTINFEVSEDGTNWTFLQVQQEGTNNILTSVTGATTTSVVVYEGSVAGLAQIRARISGFSAGTATVTAHAIPSTDAPRVMNANVAVLPSIVQKIGALGTGGQASLAKAFAANNTQGNSIIVVCAVGNGTTATVTDSAGNTYTNAVNAAVSTTFSSQIFYATNIAGGANTVTVTPSASVSIAFEQYELAGLITPSTGVLDLALTNTSSGGSTTASTAAMDPLAPNEFIFMGIGVGTATSTLTVATGWSQDTATTNNVGGTPSGLFSFCSSSQYLGSLKGVTPSVTLGTSEPWSIAVASFRSVQIAVSGSMTPVASSTGGAQYFHLVSANTTNATVVKAAPGTLYNVILSCNTSAAARYLKFYDTATAPTAGSGTIVQVVQAPLLAASTGSTTVVNFGPAGMQFKNGIAFVTVTTLPDAGSTAVATSDLSIDLCYA
jgi:hypothetical protein